MFLLNIRLAAAIKSCGLFSQVFICVCWESVGKKDRQVTKKVFKGGRRGTSFRLSSLKNHIFPTFTAASPKIFVKGVLRFSHSCYTIGGRNLGILLQKKRVLL